MKQYLLVDRKSCTGTILIKELTRTGVSCSNGRTQCVNSIEQTVNSDQKKLITDHCSLASQVPAIFV